MNKKKSVLYQVKQLNHIFIKITVTCAPSLTPLVRDWLLHWTASVRCPLLTFLI